MTVLRLNALLLEAGFDLAEVALVRHQTHLPGKPTPFALWRQNPNEFERWQSYQSSLDRSFFSRPYWASFVVSPNRNTLFVGIYRTRMIGTVPIGTIDPLTGVYPGSDKSPPVQCDLYETSLDDRLSNYSGRLSIEWGKGFRRWTQSARNQDKEIVQLALGLDDPEFPGYSSFITNLADLTSIPVSWIAALAAVRGVYLLTCPKTKEQYVGKASGSQGFWGRWQQYLTDGSGGNVAMMARDPSNYQISILETCGSSATDAEIDALEALWKQKLQSREMGLNRN